MKQGSLQATADLDEVRRDFERWRQSRRFGARIPEELWQAAAEVGREIGVSKASRELCLDYYKLRRRAESTPEQRPDAESPQERKFLEIPLCAGPECILEVEDARGVRLRVELKGAMPGHLETLARTFWSLAR